MINGNSSAEATSLPSVLLTTWSEHLTPLPKDDAVGAENWQTILKVRDAVNKVLEHCRNYGTIGSALEAAVTLYCPKDLQNALATLGDELRFVLITSSATVHPQKARTTDAVETDCSGLFIKVEASPHSKCARCWHRRKDVGSEPSHPTICLRCVENIDGAGEKRVHA